MEHAFLFLVRSSDKARHVSANHEAIAFYTQVIEVSQRSAPPLDATQLLPVYEAHGLVRLILTQYDEAISDFQMMRQLAQDTGNVHQEGESLCHLAMAHWSKFSEDHFPFVE